MDEVIKLVTIICFISFTIWLLTGIIINSIELYNTISKWKRIRMPRIRWHSPLANTFVMKQQAHKQPTTQCAKCKGEVVNTIEGLCAGCWEE